MTRDEVVDADRHDRQVRHRRDARAAAAGPGGRRPSEQATAELIGQFGVGFYSSFMVADRVDAGHPQGRQPTPACAGSRPARAPTRSPTAPDAPQGTAVTLHLKPEDAEDALHDYANPATVRGIVKRYSDFITWPIRMAAEPERGRRRSPAEPETVNSRKALWARPAERRLRRGVHRVLPARQPRLAASRWRPSGCPPRARSSTRRCCSCPATRRWTCSCASAKRGVQLYVKRVFIMDDCEALVPEYLRFVKGVVDADDLSLNISREILQQDRQIQLIRKRLVKKVLSTVKTMLDDEPEKYATFWTRARPGGQGGPALRPRQPGGDPGDLLVPVHARRRASRRRCATTSTRMPEGQDAIYYATGESRSALENSPHMEAFRAKGYEVLLLTDPVDEVWVDAVPDVRRQAVRPRSPRARSTSAATTSTTTPSRASTPCSPGWRATLADDVKEVRLSHRLTTSAACLVGDPGDLTPTLEKMYRAMGQELPKVKRILELNPQHPLVTGLRDRARAAAGRRRAGRHRPAAATAWRCSPRAASSPSRPRSSRSCRGSWRGRSDECRFRSRSVRRTTSRRRPYAHARDHAERHRRRRRRDAGGLVRSAGRRTAWTRRTCWRNCVARTARLTGCCWAGRRSRTSAATGPARPTTRRASPPI